MNLRDLRYLVALADERHFGKAAERCFVSQPTLSAQNRKLEDRLHQANIIIAFQKKVADILGIPLETPPADENE